jgi:hypothetical protein
MAEIVSGSVSSAEDLHDDDVPVVNGTMEATWRIDRSRHRLERIWGITFDRERPVFSSTSSWLLGRNLAPLDEEAARLLSLVDGVTPWSAIVERYASLRELPLDEGRQAATGIVRGLLAEDLVLAQSVVPAEGVSGR